jgi:hypothetical protein
MGLMAAKLSGRATAVLRLMRGDPDPTYGGEGWGDGCRDGDVYWIAALPNIGRVTIEELEQAGWITKDGYKHRLTKMNEDSGDFGDFGDLWVIDA